MILEQNVKIKTNPANYKHYKTFGYDITLKEIEVNVFHLTKNNQSIIKYQCDNCNKVYEKRHDYLIKYNPHYCKECKKIKRAETNLQKYGVRTPLENKDIYKKMQETVKEHYGVENVSQSKEIQEKIAQTNIKKYGVAHVLQCEEIKKKQIQTSIDKYGDIYAKTDNFLDYMKIYNEEHFDGKWFAQTKDFKDKSKQTCLEKYGTVNYISSKEGKERFKQTCLERYNVENPMQNIKIHSKMVKTLYNNGKGQSSRIQRELCEFLGGTLNYPFYNLMLDIFYNNIDIEYDGGGHDLQVKLGTVTKQEKIIKDRKRDYFVISKGIKVIRVYNPNDKKFDFAIVKNAIECIKERHFVKVDVETNSLIFVK